MVVVGSRARRALALVVSLANMDPNGTSPALDAVRSASGAGLRPVVIVRHARTADNAAKVLVGRRDVALDAHGLSQAARLRPVIEALRPSLVLVSPLRRARQTLEGVSPVSVDPRLVEVHHGEIEGLREADFQARYGAFLVRWRADPEHTAIPGGESLGQAVARAFPALLEAAGPATPPGPVVICSHQLVIAGLLCRCLDLPLARYRDFTCRNTAVNVLAFHGDRWTLLLADDLGHLDD